MVPNQGVFSPQIDYNLITGPPSPVADIIPDDEHEDHEIDEAIQPVQRIQPASPAPAEEEPMRRPEMLTTPPLIGPPHTPKSQPPAKRI
jgi:hypothetical protein